MARPVRQDQIKATPPEDGSRPVAVASASSATDRAYRPGGQVGAMHAELARRLAASEAGAPFVESPADRAMRLASAAAGYGALAAAYAGVVMLIVR